MKVRELIQELEKFPPMFQVALEVEEQNEENPNITSKVDILISSLYIQEKSPGVVFVALFDPNNEPEL